MAAEDPEARLKTPEAPSLSGRLFSATLRCDNCDTDTPHRVLRWTSGTTRSSGALSGTARCRRCGWVHPFAILRPPRVEVSVVVSEGPRSVHQLLLLPSTVRVEQGGRLPGSEESLFVRRIETRSRHTVSSAWPSEIATVWAARDVGAVVAVSVIEGARTRSDRLTLPRGSRLTVGDPLTVRGERLQIVGLRARGKTWRRPEDSFPAVEVTRVYTRRTEIPPAGRRLWSTGRDRPSSRTSSFSRSSRSRSGPGDKTTRTTPRARSAAGGAAHQSVSPS